MLITSKQKPQRAIVDKDATPQQIQASFGQVNKRHQWIAMVEN